MLATQHTHIQRTHAKLFPIALGGGGRKSQAALAAIINHNFFFHSVIKVSKYT